MQNRRIKVVFVVAHDAYLKGGRNICKLLEQHSNFDVSWLTTSKCLAGTGVGFININEVGAVNEVVQADVIFAGLGGRDLNRLITCIKGNAPSIRQKTPHIVSYFPGALHLNIFEALVVRLRADKVLLNCKRDYKLYRRIALATIGRDNGMVLGAPWIGQQPTPNLHNDIDLLFVEQSIVPESCMKRTRLVEHLAKLSVRRPDWRIVVALRARKDQASSHQVEYCLKEIAECLQGHAHHLEFSYEDVDLLLSRSKRVATIASSVAFTSLAWQKPTFFINNLGINKAWGNDLFKRSGYMASLHEIEKCSFTITSWYRDFIQYPQPDIIGSTLKISGRSYVKVIPKVWICNLPLICHLFFFYVRNYKNPWVEVSKAFRSVRKINDAIISLKGNCNVKK